MIGARAVGKVVNDDRADWHEAWALFPGDVAYVWHSALHGSDVEGSLAEAGLKTRSQIIWDKTRLVIGRGDYHWQHEPCWYAVRKGKRGQWAGGRAHFGGGERWIKGRFSDRRGNCCLVGALDFVSGHHAIKGDAAERYLADAISDERGWRIRRHENGEDYARLRAALRRAMRGEWYRASETLLRRDSLSDFNDGCKDFAELRALIVEARATAMNDADPGPAPRPRLEIERDELVMA